MIIRQGEHNSINFSVGSVINGVEEKHMVYEVEMPKVTCTSLDHAHVIQNQVNELVVELMNELIEND